MPPAPRGKPWAVPACQIRDRGSCQKGQRDWTCPHQQSHDDEVIMVATDTAESSARECNRVPSELGATLALAVMKLDLASHVEFGGHPCNFILLIFDISATRQMTVQSRSFASGV